MERGRQTFGAPAKEFVMRQKGVLSLALHIVTSDACKTSLSFSVMLLRLPPPLRSVSDFVMLKETCAGVLAVQDVCGLSPTDSPLSC